MVCAALLLFAQQQPQQPSNDVPAPAQTKHFSSAAAQRFQQKMDAINENAMREPRSTRPTVLTDEEGNAWFAEGGVKLPNGVKKLTYKNENGTIVANTTVDFDQITSGKHSYNPLLLLFTGTHDVTVTATASGDRGTANVKIESAELDGATIPRPALQFFVEKYVQPKYPHVSLDNHFIMPAHIDTAVVGNGEVTLTQK